MSKALEVHEFVAARLDQETLNPAWVRSAHGPHWQQTGVDALFGFLPSRAAALSESPGASLDS